jgi:hypothetical protein
MAVEDIILPVQFPEQSDILSTWNTHWQEATSYRGGLENHDPVFRHSLNKYPVGHT